MKPKAQLPTWRREVLKLRTKMENWTSTFPRQQSKLILLTVRLFYQQFPISWDTGFFFSFKTINYFHSILNFQTYFVFIELKWKMWFACTLKPSPCWFLVKPNVPLLNATIFHVDSNLNFFYMFSNNNKKQRNCLCVHFSLTWETLFCGLERNVLQAQAPSFHPSERYLWWFTPGLPQEMLTTWNKIPPLPRAINKPEICKSFSLQRWGEELPWSIIIILSVDFNMAIKVHKGSTQVNERGCN